MPQSPTWESSGLVLPGPACHRRFWPALVAGPALIGAPFALGPVFLIAGWFSARSLAGRGPGGFVRSRLLPQCATGRVCPAYRPSDAYVGDCGKGDLTMPLGPRDVQVGVMWFVAALLVFSAAYVRRVLPAPASRRPLRTGAQAAAALVIAASSLVAARI